MNARIASIVTALCVSAAPAARAQDAQAPADVREDTEAQARALVEAVLGGSDAETDDLAGWADRVIGDALAGAGSPVIGPVPAEREAAGPTGGLDASGGTGPVQAAGPAQATAPAQAGEVIVFASLSMPEPSWRQWSRQAARLGVPLVLRGVDRNGLAATAQRIAARRAPDGAGASVDPRLFRLFRIGHVPAVAVVPGGVPACTSPGCSGDAPPRFDLVSGNIGLEAALEAIAREGDAGRDAARRHLEILRGEAK